MNREINQAPRQKTEAKCFPLPKGMLKTHIPPPFLIALTAPVGSGKSYVARILAKKLKVVHIRSDDIRVALRAEGKSYAAVPRIAAALRDEALSRGKSVIDDFDAVLPRRQRELRRAAKKYGARFFLIRIRTPETLILERLRKKRYTKKDLFTNAEEAMRVYFIRKRLHEKTPRAIADFTINNGKPLGSQIQKMVKALQRTLLFNSRHSL